MLTQVEINGKNFISIKDAAKLVSYSRDYVARLAREEKIVATQLGRQWFVDVFSIKNFAEVAELEKSVQKVRLSAERKREQAVKSEVLFVKSEISTRVVRDRLKAQMVAMLVLGFGLFSGLAFYTTSEIFSVSENNTARLGAVSSLKQTDTVFPALATEEALPIAKPKATALFNNVSETPIEIERASAALGGVEEQPLFIDESETRAMSVGDTEGIFLLGRAGEVRTPEEVAALFSDEVEVKFVDDNTGVVSYTDALDGSVSEFNFVSVPVKAKANKLTQAPI
jgi:excisionase family DNA binding protein